ncbi:MAG TPA: hypothetical protein VGQ86_09255 [Candidatus Limnocylindria bacterium]|nr:hypothetical protein [Candidatus Limnocylindria bacterium]
MFHAPLTDHVEAVTGAGAAGYVLAVVLWLIGVSIVVIRKLRTSR